MNHIPNKEGLKEPKSATIPLGYRCCCVKDCEDWKTKATSLHPIPSHNAVVQMRWFSFIRQSRGEAWNPKDDNNMPLVCGLHFRPGSFLPGTNQLTVNAVPRSDVRTRRIVLSTTENGMEKDACMSGSSPNQEVQLKHIPIIPPLVSQALQLPPQNSDSHEGNEQTRIQISKLPKPRRKRLKEGTLATGTVPGFYEQVPIYTSQPPIFVSPTVLPPLQFVRLPQNAMNKVLLTAGPQISQNKTYILSHNLNSLGAKSTVVERSATSTEAFLSSAPLPSSIPSENSEASKGFPPVLLAPKLQTIATRLLPTSTHVHPSLTTTESSNNDKKVNSVRFIPKEMNFCIVCNEDLDQEQGIEPQDIKRSREILLTVLNIRMDESKVHEHHPVCFQCNYSILDLQESLDRLIKMQLEMEKQRNELLKNIVRTFCIRSGQRNGAGNFASANVVHEHITTKWASILHPPFKRFDPAPQKDISLVKEVIQERKALRAEKQRTNALEKRIQHYGNQRQKKVSSGRDELSKEPKRRRKEERVQCPICKLELMRWSLRHHMMLHTQVIDSRHSCSACGKSFLRASNLKAHREIHKIGNISFGRPGRSFQCPYCRLIARSGKHYFQHVASKHLSGSGAREENFTFHDCDAEDCTLSFSKEEDFHLHLLTHSQEPVTCSTCTKHFALPSSLASHEIVHSESGGLQDCPYCPSFFKSESELAEHVPVHRMHVDLGAMKYECKPCGLKFVSTQQLKSHERSKHKRSRLALLGSNKMKVPYICEACGVELSSESRLKMHSYQHTHPEGFQCQQCKHVFPNPTKLWMHKHRNLCNSFTQLKNSAQPIISVESKPNGKEQPKRSRKKSESVLTKARILTLPDSSGRSKRKSYACKHCSYVSKSSACLFRRHLIVIHPEIYLGGKTFICRICWKNFATQDQLNEHRNSLHGRYKCEDCNKYLGNKAKLAQHKRIHTGERPYKCQYCEKSFTLDSNLKEHEFRHTENHPYDCSFCQKGFFRKKQLYAHIAKVHNPVHQQSLTAGEGQSETDSGPAPNNTDIAESNPSTSGRPNSALIDFDTFGVTF